MGEALSGEQHREREGDHRRQRQVELKAQRGEHDERRAAEQERRGDADRAPGQRPPEQVDRGHAETEEAKQDGGAGGRI
jgi:hypothetical protein